MIRKLSPNRKTKKCGLFNLKRAGWQANNSLQAFYQCGKQLFYFLVGRTRENKPHSGGTRVDCITGFSPKNFLPARAGSTIWLGPLRGSGISLSLDLPKHECTAMYLNSYPGKRGILYKQRNPFLFLQSSKSITYILASRDVRRNFWKGTFFFKILKG